MSDFALATDIRAGASEAQRRQVQAWVMAEAPSPVWRASRRTVERMADRLRLSGYAPDGPPQSAHGVPIELDDSVPDGFLRPSCRHAWFNAGYQMQAEPPLWLECCRYCSEQRLTSARPTPESAHPYSGVLRPTSEQESTR